ncbi:putative transporter [Anaerobiospirillum thomasii]|uniref:Putative transporter n=1 Tax=Anaerobiospirillum thomasii TaxID=179995 RepID=A0A2X0V5U9_9GAMM|nr:putative transporter [Anaerobiospirillum thomasii]SPT68085.1 putative transporter [Anaerobiospirillum thomasii]SPT70547.1 putative transporter [Anaerobiospirillum thomasii]
MSTVAFLTMCIAVAASLGILLGMVKVKGVGLGIGGVLFSGILVGHYAHELYGLTIRTAEGALTFEGGILHYVQEFGLILFVYAIGVQVGPSFFSSLRSMGLKLVSWVLVIIVMGCSIALTLHFIGIIPVDAMIGIYTGAITNTPALGAGTQMIHDMSVSLTDDGIDPIAVGFSELVVPSAYAMAYPFGVCGILMTIIVLKAVFRVNIEEEADKYFKSKSSGIPSITTVNVKVNNSDFFGKSLEDLPGLKEGRVVCSRVLRDKELLVPHHDLILQDGDVLHLVGVPKDVSATVKVIGKPSSELLTTRGTKISVQRIVVTNSQVYGKTLGSLHLDSRFEIVVSRVIRSGIQFIPTPDMQLQFGDTLNVVGHEDDIKAAGNVVGNSTAELHKVAMLPIFLGLILGMILGNIPIPVSGVPAPLKLGIAGGPLVVAILLSRFGEALTFQKMHWYIPQAGLSALREIGITLFLSIVGICAGASGFFETLQGPGLSWMMWGAIITITPLMIVGFLAYKFSKINYLVLSGMLAGSCTDPPALAFANSMHSNPEASSLGYATVYPITMFLRILSPQIMIIIAVLFADFGA